MAFDGRQHNDSGRAANATQFACVCACVCVWLYKRKLTIEKRRHHGIEMSRGPRRNKLLLAASLRPCRVSDTNLLAMPPTCLAPPSACPPCLHSLLHIHPSPCGTPLSLPILSILDLCSFPRSLSTLHPNCLSVSFPLSLSKHLASHLSLTPVVPTAYNHSLTRSHTVLDLLGTPPHHHHLRFRALLRSSSPPYTI